MLSIINKYNKINIQLINAYAVQQCNDNGNEIIIIQTGIIIICKLQFINYGKTGTEIFNYREGRTQLEEAL